MRRSRGPRVTALRWPEAGVSGGGSAAVDLGTLVPGALLLKVAHSNVTVEACAVLDLQPAHIDVTAQLCVLAEDQLVACVEGAFDVSLDRDVGSLQQGLHLRAGGNIDVARDAKLALGTTVQVHVALVSQLAF